MDSRPVQSVSRENSCSNEPSALDSSQSSDHRSVSEVVSSEPDVAKSGQLQVGDSRPEPCTGFTGHKSPDVTVDEAEVSLRSSKSADMIGRSAGISHGPQTAASGIDADRDASSNNVVQQSDGNEAFGGKATCDLAHNDSLDTKPSLDTVGSKDDQEQDDADLTTRNGLSVQQEDISVHVDDTLSENQSSSSTLASGNGTKLSPVDAECQPLETELHKREMPASDVEPAVRQTAPKSPVSDVRTSPEENKELSQSLGSRTDDMSVSAHDVPSAGSRSSSRSYSTSSRCSASDASRAHSGSSKAAVAESDRSDNTDTVNGRSASSIDGLRSSVSSKTRSADSSRSATANSNRSSGSNKRDMVDGEVYDRADSVRSGSGSRVDDVCNSVSSKTYDIDNEGKAKSIHTASRTSHTASLQHGADFALSNDAVNHAGSEAQQQQEDVGANTDDDVTDLEADQSLQTKPSEKVQALVDGVSAITPAEAKERQELALDEEVLNLKDEQMPELDSDSDLNEDMRGSFHSGIDSGSFPKSTSEPQSDTSESRTGRKSNDLHRIIRKVAAAVESFATEGNATSTKIRSADEGALPDDRRDRVADDTTQSLLVDAVDKMLAVRNHKQTAMSQLSTVPTVALSPPALTDSGKSASTSSDGQVCPLFTAA